MKKNNKVKDKSKAKVIEQTNTNINSKFNYTVSLGVDATKNIMKVKKTTKDRVVHILVIVSIVLMVGVLVWDVIRGAGIVIDLIILIALCCLEVFNIIMPFIILRMQRKFLGQVLAEGFDYTLSEIDKDKCLESYYKNNKLVMQNCFDMSELVGVVEESGYVFLVFNNFAAGIFDLNTLQNSTKEAFLELLNNRIAINKSVKLDKHKKRRMDRLK